MLSPLTTYSPSGTSSTPSSMLYTRSVLSDKMTLVVWSNPSSLPCAAKGHQLARRGRRGDGTNDDGPAVLGDYEDLLCGGRGGGTREGREGGATR